MKTGIERLKPKKKLNDLDKYIIFSFIVMLVYTVLEFIVSTVTGVSHETLTVSLYSAFGGELLITALLKKWKISRRETQ